MSLAFNGSTSGLTRTTGANGLSNTYPFAVAGWLRYTASAGEYRFPFHWLNAASSAGILIGESGATGKFFQQLGATDGGWNWNTGANTTGGLWTFWYIVSESPTSHKAYLGGLTATFTDLATLDLSTLTRFYVGQESSGGARWQGDLAELAIWQGTVPDAAGWTALQGGAVPESVASSGIRAVWPMLTQASTQTDIIGGLVLTAANTSQGATHPIARPGVLYSSDFEGLTVGATPSEWALAGGSGLQVQSTSPVRGTRSFGQASSGDAAYWTGNTSLVNQGIRFAQINQGTHCMGALLRVQGGSQNRSYRCEVFNSAGNIFCAVHVRDNGQVSYDSVMVGPSSVGDVVHFEARAIGSTVELRLWLNGAARPSTPTLSKVTTYYPSGGIGLVKLGDFAFTTADDVVITYGAGGEDLFYPPPSSIIGGGVTLDNAVAAGTLSVSASDIGGGVTLADAIAGGALGMQPGIVSALALRNWNGALQTSVTIPVVTVCRLSDGAQVLTLTNQTTHASTGDLTITNASLLVGTWYMVMGWNADGSARFAVPLQATA